MKTPMQELIKELKDLQESLDPYGLHDAIEFAESMLEKEKEVIVDAFVDGKLDGWHNQWADANDYYNETFNTKEK